MHFNEQIVRNLKSTAAYTWYTLNSHKFLKHLTTNKSILSGPFGGNNQHSHPHIHEQKREEKKNLIEQSKHEYPFEKS
jgi:hypothetical protein